MQHTTHDFKHLYSGIYPDGSKIATQLCESCGLVELNIASPHILAEDGAPLQQFFYLNQIQVNEMAYAMLKGNNRFAHIIEQRVSAAPMSSIRSGV